MPAGHYENFPVASLLCPPAIRPAVAALYTFARTADDIADEGDATPEARRAELAAYRRALAAIAAGQAPPAWPQVFGPLQHVLVRHGLPLPWLQALLSAFEQDTGNPPYANRSELLDYCARSANPIGRLLLHLVGLAREPELALSDDICTALQLINFWQDLSRDLPRGRNYLPQDEVPGAAPTPAQVAALCRWAEGLMRRGAPLALRVPGRFGWELRLVVLGGLRVLEKIRAMDHDTLHRRPVLNLGDAALVVARALRYRRYTQPLATEHLP
jgi:hydroxysqualene synthase